MRLFYKLILIIILPVVALLVLLTTVLSTNSMRHLKQEVKNRLNIVLKCSQVLIHHDVDLIKRAVSEIESIKLLQNYYLSNDMDLSDNLENIRVSIEEQLQQYAQTHKEFKNISILEVNGNGITKITDGIVNYDYSDVSRSNQFQKSLGLRENEFYISDIFSDNKNDVPMLSVSSLYYFKGQGRAVIMVTVKTQDYFGRVLKDLDAGKNGSIYLINKDGRVIARSDSVKINKNVRHPYSTLQRTSIPLGIGGIRIVVSQPTNDAYASARQIRLFSLDMTLLITICLLLLIYFVNRKIIIDALNEISNAVKKISTGDFDVKIVCLGNDELGHLGESFNTMTHDLKEMVLAKEREIIQRKQVEKEVLKLSQVVEQNPAAVILTDKNGKIDYVNKKFVDITGYSSEEVLGKNPRILKSGKRPLEEVRQMWKVLLSREVWRGEYENKKKNDVLYWASATIGSLRDDTGSITHYIGIQQDITEFKETQNALQKKIKEMKMFHDVSVDREYKMVDLKRKINELNKKLDQSALYDLNFKDPESEEEQNSEKEVEACITHLDKKVAEHNHAQELLSQENQELERAHVATLNIMQDLKKEKELALELSKKAQASTKAKSNFLANMSHEIRTPMNSILGFSDLLSKTPLTDKQKNFLNTISINGELLLGIIDDILDISKLESGKIQLEEIDFNLEALIIEVFKMVTSRMKDNPLDTYIDIQEDVPTYIKSDPTRLKQILVNLLGNAVKFTSTGSIGIIVALEEQKDQNEHNCWLRFIVKDTGIGIPQDKKETIFESFSQADESTTRKFGGTGLGLTISKAFVAAFKGKIWIESEEGKGSEVIFNIYVKKGVGKIQILKENFFKQKKVFIVDDNKITRKIMNKCCAALGLKVIGTADSSQAALHKLDKIVSSKESIPELILCDIMMDGTGGCELIKKIKKNSNFKTTNYLAVTADLKFETSKKFTKELFDAYITKPVNTKELLQAIKEALHINIAASKIEEKDEENCSGIKVLVVEDAEPNKMLIQAYFAQIGCEGDYAGNGQEAIEKLKENNDYNLCLMDLQMPIMGGIEATKIIRKDISKDLPIIALTAAVMKKDQDKTKEAGMTDFLTKPIDIMKLKEKILQCGRKKYSKS